MGLLGMALAGFAGGAQGYEQAMQRHDEEAKDIRNKQWDLMKEQRVEEAKIRAEGRAYATKKQERQDEFAHNTDPNNVKAAADAEVLRSEINNNYEDRHKDARFPTELAQYKARDAASDHTDYANRSLEHELNSFKLAQAKADFSPRDKSSIEALQAVLKEGSTSLKDETLTDAERIDIRTSMSNASDGIRAILSKYSDAQPSGNPQQKIIDDAMNIGNAKPDRSKIVEPPRPKATEHQAGIIRKKWPNGKQWPGDKYWK